MLMHYPLRQNIRRKLRNQTNPLGKFTAIHKFFQLTDDRREAIKVSARLAAVSFASLLDFAFVSGSFQDVCGEMIGVCVSV